MENKRKELTEEQKKAKLKAYSKAWRESNREALKIKRKTYRKANKEAIATREKTYHKAYYESNKEALIIKSKAYYESKRLPHHIVYCLPNYNNHGYVKYVGVTDNPNYRMQLHNYRGNNTDDWFVLQACETRQEAEEVEAEYHEKGYAGKKGFKK